MNLYNKLERHVSAYACISIYGCNSNNIFFGNMSLYNSQLLFNNSFFSRNADLFELLGTEADADSKILFRMVDFNFTEIRMYGANISRLEFIDCTFECNRFDFDFTCNTLIMQDCKNFRVLTLDGLKQLKNFNIINFVNTGRVLLHETLSNFVDSIKSNQNIFWIRGNEYQEPGYAEHRKELYVLLSFFDPSQTEYAKRISREIEIIEKIEADNQRLNEPNRGMKIFLSYSWSDEELANDIDNRLRNREYN